ncbi:MAG: M15 family metallopeptidase [Oscillospiraceae bacterium]|nr:M15 family metallopeptidase [Oscillospiraceae bacterium]
MLGLVEFLKIPERGREFLEYKHLREKDMLNLRRLNKLINITKKTFNWFLFYSVVFSFFVTGLICFCQVTDGNVWSSDECVGKDAPEYIERISGQTDEFKEKFLYANQGIEKGSEDVRTASAFITGIPKEEPEISNEDNLKSKFKAHDFKKEIAEHKFTQWNEKAPSELIVVNRYNSLPETKVDLKIVCGAEVAAVMAENLGKMIMEAKKDKVNLWVNSGYRSFERQNKLFEDQVLKEKINDKSLTDEQAKDRARSWVAMPGESEHNFGLAVDFNGCAQGPEFAAQNKWLSENAKNFGFIQRYNGENEEITKVKNEPWHYRYVGPKNSKKIAKLKLTLEEFVINLEKSLQ